RQVIRAGDDGVWNALLFVLDLVHATTHEALDGEDGVLRVGNRLTFGDLAYEPLTVLGEADHGRRGAATFCVWNDDGIATLEHGDNRVRGAEVDTDDFFCHLFSSWSFDGSTATGRPPRGPKVA